MYLDKQLKEYLDDLAARKPAPGGGSAAALTAAIGTSLMSMVANYTVGNSKYQENEQETADILIRVNKCDTILRRCVDEDVSAYLALSAAIKAGDKDEKKLQQAYKDALKPPLETCRSASECLKLCSRLVKIGNKNLITDTAIAAMVLESAFISAKFNVYINMKYICDMEFIKKIHEELAPLEENVKRLKEEIVEECEEIIG